jgi:hypothetical protein
MQDHLLEPLIAAAVIVLFIMFLLWNGLLRAPLRRAVRQKLATPSGADAQLRELLDQLRNGARTRPVLDQIKRRIAEEPSVTLQAVYLCAAGDVLRGTLSRRGMAVKYYVKALKADPFCADARNGLREVLLQQRRGYKLEQVYWMLLADVDCERCETGKVLEIWRELATLLERRRSGRARAAAIRKLLEQLDVEEEIQDCEEETFSGETPF